MPKNVNKRKPAEPPAELPAELPAVSPLSEQASVATAPPANKKKRVTKNIPAVDPAPSEVNSIAPSAVSAATSVSKPRKKRAKSDSKATSARTPSSYVLFSIKYRKSIVEESPDLTLGEISKKCGTKWKSLTEDERKVYVDEAADLKQKRLEELKLAKIGQPEKKKRTASSYLLFAMEYRKTVLDETPGMKIGEVSKLCGNKWKAMSDEEKSKWIEQAKVLKNAGNVTVP